MKLAEALSIRADLQKRVAQLKERIKESAKVQEGDEPCDNVEELYKELDDVLVSWKTWFIASTLPTFR